MLGTHVGTEHYVILAFLLLLVISLYLGVVHGESHERSIGLAVLESLTWVILAGAFCAGFALSLGPSYVAEFGYGFFTESVLSMDNLLMFSIIFSLYGVPEAYQSFLLSWGVLCMVPARAFWVATGSFILPRFGWISYVFGAALIVVGLKVFLDRGKRPDSRLLKLVLRSDWAGRAGLTSLRGGELLVTPLIVVATVEIVDAMSAVDSITAIYTVSHHPIVVYTSDVLAALMMRSLYFVMVGLLKRHRFLESSLAAIAILIGAKMIADHFVRIPVAWSVLADAAMIAIPVAFVLARPGIRRAWDSVMASRPRTVWPWNSKPGSEWLDQAGTPPAEGPGP